MQTYKKEAKSSLISLTICNECLATLYEHLDTSKMMIGLYMWINND